MKNRGWRNDQRQLIDHENRFNDCVTELEEMAFYEALEALERVLSRPVMRELAMECLRDSEKATREMHEYLGLDQPQTLAEVQEEESRYFDRYQR